MAGLTLAKGDKLSLTKAAAAAGITTALSTVAIGLAWEPQKSSGQEFDLDATAFLVDSNGKAEESGIVYYNQLASADGSVTHSGDERKGDKNGDDETISIDLAKVPANIEKIIAVITIFEADKKGQTFGQVDGAIARLYDTTNGTKTELAKFELAEDNSRDTAVHMVTLYRHNGEWKFEAAGKGQVAGLGAVAALFGLNLN